jgi:dipeptidase E
MARRLCLVSTSTVFGTRYLEHAFPELRDTLGDVRRVLFVPYALQDRDAYAAKARAAFEEMGYGLDSLHEAFDQRRAIEKAEAIFCGGGNTFRLLKALYELEVLPLIRRRVAEGMVYSGASAGSNLACPTIRTTNDMPIVEPPSLSALDLVSFQINPHYLDPAPGSDAHPRVPRGERGPGGGPARGGDPARRGGIRPAEGRGRRADLPARRGAGRGRAGRADRVAGRAGHQALRLTAIPIQVVDVKRDAAVLDGAGIAPGGDATNELRG